MKLYRGFSKVLENGVIVNEYIHTSRCPRDSDIYVHEVADSWFYEKFGIKARSKCIFCTPDISQAREYGIPHAVEVPKGIDCKIIFSAYVNDFIEIHFDINNVNSKREITQWLENKSYSMVTSIQKLPKDFNGEVMLYCTHYEVELING